MNKKKNKYIIYAALCVMLAGCGGQRTAVDGDAGSRYRRAPIREVGEEALRTDAALIDAKALQMSGHDDEALEAYAALAAKEPRCAAAWYEMSRQLLQRGWTDSARACIGRAVALADTNRWYLLQQAEVQTMQGDGRGLVATWERIVQLWPDKLEYHYELSNAYITAGDIEGAVGALNRVEKKIGVTEPISLQKQRLWNAAGKADKAEQEVEALAEAMPQEKRYQAMLAEANMKRKKYARAKKYYDRVLAADPDDEYIHIQLAEYWKAVGKPTEAAQELALAFANPKLDCRTKVQLLTSFYTAEEFYGTQSARAFGLLDTVMAHCDDTASYALLYGDVLMRQRKYGEAARWLELSLERDSSRYEVWEGLLICLTEVPDREADMAALAARAARLFPMHTLPHYLQALHDVQHERYAEALQHLEKAEKWGFTKGYLEAETYGLMAEAAYRTGDYERAWRCFDRCLELHPDDWGTLNNYAYYLSERGIELEKALAMSRRTIEAEPDNANSLDTYAWILHLLGRDAEGLPYMRKAVKLDPQSETLQRHLKEMEP
jgi:tetratricopeptide (TPR) repeat protein